MMSKGIESSIMAGDSLLVYFIKSVLFHPDQKAIFLNGSDNVQVMIRVSDINVYLKCPRMCYFVNRGHDLVGNTTPGYLERLILKELALTYGSAYDNGDRLSILNTELDRISNEIRAVYPTELAGIDDDKLAGSVSNVRSCLENISLNLSTTGDFYVHKSIQFETLLHSGKFGLTGSPDKLIQIEGGIIPSIIKTGDMPENGVWHSDRLQLAAYAILAEERYNTVVERGFVEYARWGKIREVTIKRHERRKVLQIRDKIKKIQNGAMPEKPENPPCTYCNFNGICDVKSTLASRFF